ncbi:MAG: hypothetical protein AAGJ84_16290 [Pseudomonadota bacterium]
MRTDRDTVSALFAPEPKPGKKAPLFTVWVDLLFGGLGQTEPHVETVTITRDAYEELQTGPKPASPETKTKEMVDA